MFRIRLEAEAGEGHSAEQRAKWVAATALRAAGFSGDDAPLGPATVTKDRYPPFWFGRYRCDGPRWCAKSRSLPGASGTSLCTSLSGGSTTGRCPGYRASALTMIQGCWSETGQPASRLWRARRPLASVSRSRGKGGEPSWRADACGCLLKPACRGGPLPVVRCTGRQLRKPARPTELPDR